MKVQNIIKRLELAGAKGMQVTVTRTTWGHHVELNALLNGYDVQVTDQLTDREHQLSASQVESWFKSQDTDYYCVKRHGEESDPMSDYCAWSFYHAINRLDVVATR